MTATVRSRLPFLALLLSLSLPGIVAGQEQAERLRPVGINGALVIGGGGKLPEAVFDRFLQLAGGPTANLVILTNQKNNNRLLEPWQTRKAETVATVPFPAKQTDPAPAALAKADGVWLDAGDPGVLAGSACGKELAAVLERGGVVGGNTDTATVLAAMFLQGDGSDPRPGVSLLPGVVLGTANQAAMLRGLAKHRGLFGIRIDEGTALVARGRQLRVLGDGAATVYLAPSPGRPAKTLTLKGSEEGDLTALRRSALARAAAPFPPRPAAIPEVAGGSLVIVGGGGMTADVTKKFIDLAGGPDALIVILPTANPDPVPMTEGEFLKRAGARNIKVLPGRNLKSVDGPDSLAALEKAGGIWFGGGRQWRFVDAYEGTKALELMRAVLKRGGVIGGSSAGATIQGDYLCRGSPFGNLEIMYEGYERGFAFLPGVAIDQHFAQRKRFADMTELVKTFPQLLGIGIDEATALIVKGHVAEIMGRSQAHFYDRGRKVKDGQPDYDSVKAGNRYDLKARKVLTAAP